MHTGGWDGPERRSGADRRVGGSRRSGGVPRAERTHRRITVALPQALLMVIERLAHQDVRSITGEMRILLREAVAARRAQ